MHDLVINFQHKFHALVLLSGKFNNQYYVLNPVSYHWDIWHPLWRFYSPELIESLKSPTQALISIKRSLKLIPGYWILERKRDESNVFNLKGSHSCSISMYFWIIGFTVLSSYIWLPTHQCLYKSIASVWGLSNNEWVITFIYIKKRFLRQKIGLNYWMSNSVAKKNAGTEYYWYNSRNLTHESC